MHSGVLRVDAGLPALAARPKRQHGSACVLARCGVQSSGILVALWPTCVVLSRHASSPVAATQWGPHGLLSPRIFLFLGGMKSQYLDSAHVDSRV